ncbi:MAG: TetR/AcrR family transcriptional regulator [Sphingomonadales bacterium]|nr:TetR/AcrR family transcriptional regulator [Sphingomonadales bacterium]NCO47523.1 TetR/AcrR family transcriptional regulator [Sphingomonadales bacterium]NCO98971.1 TetR/AcrR family transcriptional regulator [Sphingomonadales bacterium]NCP25469.1 TetR/AcrR family transcriptional regulator [Sphingomonadales bacterium]NCP44678.1 TetR/AcrR family transcriptional regulator [Sphingomonadales bacterium]
MPRPETDIAATRSKIIAAADQMIQEKGAISFTMSDLAIAVGMSPSNLYRFFENKDALAEAMAGEWFAELLVIMEDLVSAEMPVEEKLYQFFAKRVVIKRARYEDDPELFESYMELGDEHFEVIKGYVDLADHYMATILAEAMEKGYFKGLELDAVVSLVNTMMQPFCNPTLMMQMMHLATEERLRIVINTILSGLKADEEQAVIKPELHIAG